ncbi:MAG: hypothetical protein JSR40_04555, partial [Proteobacteria bacterium]|nr:hypothetical protein [Pseudomonadota bacterium]
MSESSGATLIATGMLPFVVLVSAALTAPVSMALLALYRRAVLRSMAERGEAATDARPEAPATVLPPPAVELQLEFFTGPATAVPAATQVRAARALRRAGAVQLAGGIAYAAVLAAAWMV